MNGLSPPVVWVYLGTFGLIAVPGCSSGGTVAGLEPQPQVATISVIAAPASVSVGEVALVTVRATTASGGNAPAEVEWATSGGQLVVVSDSQAQFSAAVPGSYQVTARAVADPFPTDSVHIQVAAPLSPLVSVQVSPDSVDLLPGGITAFTVTGTRQDGSTMIPAVAWSAAGGAITASGGFTAGSSTGVFRVIALVQGATLADTAVVVIRNSDTGGPGFSNEPPGLSWPWTITAQQPNPFDALPRRPGAADGRPFYALDSFGWILEDGDYSRVTIAVDPERGNVLQCQLLSGDPGGRAAFTAIAGGGGDYGISSGSGALFIARRLFIAFYVKLSPNWSDANEATKLVMLWSSKQGQANNPIFLSRRAKPYVTSSVAIQNGIDPTSFIWSSTGYSRNAWHKMEYYLEQNTPGIANGVLKTWVDGSPVLNLSNVKWIGAGDTPGNYNWLKFNLVYGGGSLPVPSDMYALIDDWYVKVGP